VWKTEKSHSLPETYSKDSSVALVTRKRTGRQENRCRIPSRNNTFSSLQKIYVEPGTRSVCCPGGNKKPFPGWNGRRVKFLLEAESTPRS
jgi:hypothetical protein